MAGWQVNDWAFAYSSEDEYWYPAVITKVMGNKFKVRYDCDDSEEVVDADSLDDYRTYAGEKGAECWVEADQVYYPVVILDTHDDDEQAYVKYDDGVKEWTDLSNLRFEDV